MNYRNVLVYAILLAVVDALMIIFLKDRLEETAVIIGLVFVNLSMVSIIVFTEVYPKTANAYVYSFSSSMFAATFFIIELIVAVAIIAVDPMANEDWQHILLYCVQPIMFLIYVIYMIFNASVNFHSGKIDIATEKRRKEFNSVLYPLIDKAMRESRGQPFFKQVEKACDEVRSLPADSNDATKPVDDELILLANELNDCISRKDESAVKAVCDKLIEASAKKRQAASSNQN